MFVYEKWSISQRLEYFPGCSPLLTWKGRSVSSCSIWMLQQMKSTAGFLLCANAQHNFFLQKMWLLREARLLAVVSMQSCCLGAVHTAGYSALKSLPQEAVSRHFSGSQPGQFPAAQFLGWLGTNGMSCPRQRKEASYWNAKATAALCCFLGTSPHLSACQHSPYSLFTCLWQGVENSKWIFRLARLKLSLKISF